MTEPRLSKIDFAEGEILRMLEEGELRPGDPLQQRTIAKRLDVSPTPVREAFRRLEVAGVIVNHPHRGPHVAEPVNATDPDAMRVRAALDHVGVDLAVQNATAADVAELHRLNEAYATAMGTEARELHRQLHFKIIEIAGSPLLKIQMRVLWSVLANGALSSRDRSDSASHHGALIDAIAAGDADRARTLMDEHYTPQPPPG